MLRRYAFASGVILSFVFLTTCGSSKSGGGLPIVAGSSKVSLTMGDTPPAGIAVLSFQVTVTGAVLNSSGGNASLVSAPTTVELGQLLVETAYLNTASVRTGTYNSATFTFATPKLTVFNGSSAVIGACAVGAVCQLTPALTPGSVTYSATPFPLAIGIDTPLGLSLDFDLNNSLQNDLSISPSVAVSQLTPSGADGQLEDENVVGSITAVGTTNNQFTLQNAVTGLSLTYKVDSNTLYPDPGAASLSSLAVGQVVEVDAHLLAGGTFLATRVSLKESSSEGMLEGTVTSVDSATQFKMVVYDEEPDIAGVAVGDPVTISIQSGASFEIDAHDLIIPIGLGLTFGSAGDLLVGQSVQVRPLSVAPGTISTNRVRLRRTRLTASVFLPSSPNLFVNPPSLFGSATPAITQIQVQTSDQTTYQGVIGFTALSLNDTVSVRGLLFKNVTLGTPPTLVADKVRKR